MCYLDRMSEPEPAIFDEVDQDAEAAADAEAIADFEAGRVISNEAMMAWLRSWGTSDKLPPPEIGD